MILSAYVYSHCVISDNRKKTVYKLVYALEYRSAKGPCYLIDFSRINEDANPGIIIKKA